MRESGGVGERMVVVDLMWIGGGGGRGKVRVRSPWTGIKLKKKGSPVRLESNGIEDEDEGGKAGNRSDGWNCSDTICHDPDGSDMLGSVRTRLRE